MSDMFIRRGDFSAIRQRSIALMRATRHHMPTTLATPSRTWQAPVIIIDGRSGSGKSTLAHELQNELHIAGICNAQLTGPDLWFPGWDGLAAATRTLEDLLTNPHRHPGFYEWDWQSNRWGRYHLLDRNQPLIIEGCGTLTTTSAQACDLCIWVDAPATQRRQRALARDGNMFAPYWDVWATQEDEHIRRHQPQQHADITLNTTAHRAFPAPQKEQ